jgi:hypothetical protein
MHFNAGGFDMVSQTFGVTNMVSQGRMGWVSADGVSTLILCSELHAFTKVPVHRW